MNRQTLLSWSLFGLVAKGKNDKVLISSSRVFHLTFPENEVPLFNELPKILNEKRTIQVGVYYY
jgi:hypothetical protein